MLASWACCRPVAGAGGWGWWLGLWLCGWAWGWAGKPCTDADTVSTGQGAVAAFIRAVDLRLELVLHQLAQRGRPRVEPRREQPLLDLVDRVLDVTLELPARHLDGEERVVPGQRWSTESSRQAPRGATSRHQLGLASRCKQRTLSRCCRLRRGTLRS